VRCPSTWAFGTIDVVGKPLTSNDSTPSVDSNIDADRPAPPPTTMRAGAALSVMAIISVRGFRRNFGDVHHTF
jgi:hypothetical protein